MKNRDVYFLQGQKGGRKYFFLKGKKVAFFPMGWSSLWRQTAAGFSIMTHWQPPSAVNSDDLFSCFLPCRAGVAL